MEYDVNELVIPWAFIIVSAVSGAFGSLLGIFLVLPQGKTLTTKTIDTCVRMLGGGIAAGLWNTLVSEYSGLISGKVGHVIGVAGGIGFAWWFVMGGISVYLNRFRQTGPVSISIPGRFSWLAEILNSISLKPPIEEKKIPSNPPVVITPTPDGEVKPPVVITPTADGEVKPPVIRPTAVEDKQTGGGT